MKVTKEIIDNNGNTYRLELKMSLSEMTFERRVFLNIYCKKKGKRTFKPLIDHMEFTRGMGSEAGEKLLDEYRSMVPFDLDIILYEMSKELAEMMTVRITAPISTIFRY